MRTLTLDEFIEHFDAVMDAVVDGESFIITRDGRAIADLVPRREIEIDHEVSDTV